MLSIKDLVFKEWLVRKLVDYYVELYIEKVVSINVVKLKLPTTMRIHSVVNVSWVVRYWKPVRRQRVEKLKAVKVNREEKWEVKKILNKQKIREVTKYLVQ